MKQEEKLKELFGKEESKQENYVKSELDVAVETMGQQAFCDWVDETLRILKEEKESDLPPEVWSTGYDRFGLVLGPNTSRKRSNAILFTDLKAGLTYGMELTAVGGNSGQSDWSEPATKAAE